METCSRVRNLRSNSSFFQEPFKQGKDWLKRNCLKPHMGVMKIGTLFFFKFCGAYGRVDVKGHSKVLTPTWDKSWLMQEVCVWIEC